MIRLDIREAGFDAAFTALVNARREADADVSRDVAAIVARVRIEGDAALKDYTNRFDGHDLDSSGWEIGKAERQAALANLDPELRKAIELAAARIAEYHVAQKPDDRDHTDAAGVRLGARWRAVDAAGLYVPGGRAAYPSTVLMNAIPARVAGVERLVMVTPTPKGEVNDLVLAAAEIAGVDEVYRVGGAQAIAALAYGTDRIRPVDVIVGPGNAWVAEAKRQLYGVVGIDMVAGPSEIVVVADAENDPAWIAADLLSQPSMIRPASRSCSPTIPASRTRSSPQWRRSWPRFPPARPRASRGRPMARSWSRLRSTRRCPWSIGSRPSISSLRSTIRGICSTRSAMPDRSSSAVIRPRRLEIMLPAPTTSFPPAAARASRRGFRCSIS